ncbi:MULTISPECIES: hypothetical protein [unclassified Shewanella]|uniref:hypothetical protein n=1 Tax=unclassified Shewanella TaxID=196818 RepID=UPI002FCD75C9
MKALLLISTLLMALPAQSEVYRCAGNVYQADPCNESSKPMDLSNVGSVVASDSAFKQADISSYIRNREIEREITKHENRRKKVLTTRDNRMTNLKNRGRHANNNLAGATWQQSLAQEMNAITQQADTEVSTIDRQITQLRSEIK